MKLTFHGTRGSLERGNARHGMEAAIAWDGMTLEVKP
jgi:hypothetical protein